MLSHAYFPIKNNGLDLHARTRIAVDYVVAGGCAVVCDSDTLRRNINGLPVGAVLVDESLPDGISLCVAACEAGHRVVVSDGDLIDNVPRDVAQAFADVAHGYVATTQASADLVVGCHAEAVGSVLADLATPTFDPAYAQEAEDIRECHGEFALFVVGDGRGPDEDELIDAALICAPLCRAIIHCGEYGGQGKGLERLKGRGLIISYGQPMPAWLKAARVVVSADNPAPTLAAMMGRQGLRLSRNACPKRDARDPATLVADTTPTAPDAPALGAQIMSAMMGRDTIQWPALDAALPGWRAAQAGHAISRALARHATPVAESVGAWNGGARPPVHIETINFRRLCLEFGKILGAKKIGIQTLDNSAFMLIPQ